MGIDFSSDETRARDKKRLEEMAARFRAEEQPFWRRSGIDNGRIAHDGIMRAVIAVGLYLALGFGFVLILLKQILLGTVGLIDSVIGSDKKR